MLVTLRDLKPNPWRNFAIDPMDDEAVAKLADSIGARGFWGGVVCRRNGGGDFEIACGHHRVKAAIAAGIDAADLFVGDLDDDAMIEVYAIENSTQRGNTSTALTGSVAAAVRKIAHDALWRGTSQKFLGRSLQTIAGQLATERGIGEDAVLKQLDGASGFNLGNVRQAITNLKSSGEYAAIIARVQQEIEAERLAAEEAERQAEQERLAAEEAARRAEAERLAAEERAKAAKAEADRKRAEQERAKAEADAKAAEERRAKAEEASKTAAVARKSRTDAAVTAEKAVRASGSKEATFDFKGVAQHLKTPHHIDVEPGDVLGMPEDIPHINDPKLYEDLDVEPAPKPKRSRRKAVKP